MFSFTFHIPFKNGDKFKVLPLSDIHYDGRGKNSLCDSDKLKRDLAERVDDKTIILSIGDNFGGIIPSDVKRYRKTHDAAEGEDILDESINGLAEILMPYREQIYGLGDGNHEQSILAHCGTDMTRRLIAILNHGRKNPVEIQHLGYSWLLRFAFRRKGGGGRSVIIRGHHGWGGGSRTQGADVTKFSHDAQYWNANLFLYGHVHKMKINDIEEGSMVGERGWKTTRKRMCICGTYQKTYSDSRSATYAEMKGYPPTTLRHPIIYLMPNSNYPDVLITITT
jgi:hypothetical protein